MRRRIVMAITMILVVQLLITGSIGLLNLTSRNAMKDMPPGVPMTMEQKITPAQRQAAAERAVAARRGAEIHSVASLAQTAIAPDAAHAQTGIDPKVPDYFGTSPNYANSPLPPNVTFTSPISGTTAEAIATVQTVVGPGGVVTRGVVTAVKVINPGSGYTTAPTVTIAGVYGDGTGATATAVIAPINPANPALGSQVTQVTVNTGGHDYTGIRKFVDRLAVLPLPGATPNNLGQYLTLAVPDTTSYPGSDYYEIGLVEYSQQFHSDLPASKMRGYVQLNNPATKSQVTRDASGKITGWPQPSYLGPSIVASRDVPVRIKFINLLPTGTGGDLFIPVDPTVMGAGTGDKGGTETYTQNRATLHLHGGLTPWISDGTPHQWTTPAGETTSYPKGVSTQNVPDMPPAGPGEMTFFYSNQQSARLMFYHDHAYGITRLNVYAGEAAGYLLTDKYDTALTAGGSFPLPNGTTATIPANTAPGLLDTVPLIIQDKTFVPPPGQLQAEDPTWNHIWRTGVIAPALGSLWMPHVYMPNQNPADLSGTNAMGRWDYSQWFWPPTAAIHGTLPNPYYNSANPGSENPVIPGINNPSITPEAFMDTPVVNGVAYPYMPIEQKVYRFRILNASNDRTMNLQLYFAKSNGDLWDAQGNLNDPNAGEVSMVPAVGKPLPMGVVPPWPNDNRLGGVPDQKTAGPRFVQIGTEGGFLPAPVALNNRPIGYENNLRNIVVTNVNTQTLMLAPAERADVIIDFSKVPAGSKLILYNDSPAPVPAFDPRYDYYTGDWPQTDTGGAPTTLAGYGPNTRTIMQFRMKDATAGAIATPTGLPFDKDPAKMGPLTTALQNIFAASQDPIIVPQPVYNGAYGKTFGPVATRIQSTTLTFTPNSVGATPLTVNLQPKAIQELFETEYGRMNATLGVEIPNTTGVNQTTIPLGYIDPTTENITDSVTAAAPIAGTTAGTLGDGTQIWKITHNGVDTHAIHFHLFNVQIINRVGWDGQVRLPEPNEIGWKDTVRMNPLEDAIVALRPINAKTPFGTYQSIRPLDVTSPLGSTMGFWNQGPTGNPVTTINALFNFGDEFVWHCHLLGHEENDMMRPIVFNTKRVAPAAPTGVLVGNLNPASVGTTKVPQAVLGNKVVLNWTDTTPVTPGVINGSWANPQGEIGYRILRAPITTSNGKIGTYSQIVTLAANTTTFTDSPAAGSYSYQVVAFNDAAGTSAVIGSNVAIATSAAVNVTVPAPIVAPDAPTNLAYSFQAAPLGVNLTWTASTGIVTGYQVQSNINGTWTNLGAVLPATATSFTDTSVVANTSYTYQIIAKNTSTSVGTSAPLTVLTPPAAPTGLSSVPISTPPSVTLRWVAPAGPGTITSYTVQRSNDGISWLTVGSPTATSYTDTTVTQGSTYFYRVNANNYYVDPVTKVALVGGASVMTNAINVTVTATVPAAPINLTANLLPGKNQVSLTWAPGNTIAVDTYRVYRSSDNKATWIEVTNPASPTTTTSFVDTTVVPNTSYYYHVIANTVGLGDSLSSADLNVVTLPDAPTGLALAPGTTPSPGAVSLVWSAPATGAASYNVQSSANNGTTWTDLITQTAKLSFTDTTAVGGTTYLYQVSANNSTPKPGLPSTPALQVAVPLAVPGLATSLTASVNATGVTVGWTPPTTAVTSYQIWRATSATGGTANAGTPVQVGTASASPFIDTGAAPNQLLSNTSYDYYVVAVNQTVAGQPSTTVTALTLPAAPTGLTASIVTGVTGVSLSWAAPTGTGTIQTYTIQWATSATATTWTTLASGIAGNITAYNDTTTGAASRYYRVIADNTITITTGTTTTTTGGQGPASTPATALAGSSLTLVGTPTVNSVTLSWTRPTGTITGYTIDQQPSGGSWTTATGMVSLNITGANTTSTSGLRASVTNGYTTNLAANTSYDYRVTAKNGTVAVGGASNIVTALTLPAAPTVGVTAQAGPQVTISLNATGSGKILNFSIQRRITNSGAWPAAWTTIATTANSTTTIDASVVAGTSYDYRATATNATGTSVNSATTTVAVPVPAPSAPTMNVPTSVTTGGGRATVTLTWSNVPAATGYYVYRSNTAGGNGTRIATVAMPTTTFADTGRTIGTNYYYYVVAYSTSGGTTVTSVNSNVVTIKP